MAATKNKIPWNKGKTDAVKPRKPFQRKSGFKYSRLKDTLYVIPQTIRL